MSSEAWVKLWGRTIGAVLLRDGEEVSAFEYDPAFVSSGIEVSPLVMPLSTRVYSFSELAKNTFHGLPGFLADSLPDRFGNALINTWLATQGRSPDSFNAVERLCYIGSRGMGALEFAPATGPKAGGTDLIQIGQLVELASEILSQRKDLAVSFEQEDRKQALAEILRIGTSAGGARAKALIAWNPVTHEVRSGQINAGQGFEYWLLKFDGVRGNKDKELEDPSGYGAIEYACYLMAKDCGIEMAESRLFEENNRRHFMTRRFDRTRDGRKVHMQSLGALAHYDFNLAGAYSYEQAILAIRRLGLPMSAVEEMYRRMVFNIIIRNQDDHVKNIAFLMDKAGNWSLAPAFDMTYSYNPDGLWTASHQMSMNGKRDGFSLDDFKQCANTALMKRGRAETIVSEVLEVARKWPDYAEKAGVPGPTMEKVHRSMRLAGFG